MLSTIESAHGNFLEKFGLVIGALEHMQEISRKIIEKAGSNTKKMREMCLHVESLQLNLMYDEIDELHKHYNLSVLHILTEYYLSPDGESEKTQTYYNIVSRENFNVILNNMITRIRIAAGILNKIISHKSVASQELVDLIINVSKNINSAKLINVNSQLGKKNYEICKCGERMVVIPELSELKCNSCSRTKQIIGAVFRDDQFYPQDGQKTKHGGYDMSRHYKFWIERIQAREPKTFEPEDIEKIEYVIQRDGYNKANMTCGEMRKILKDPKVNLTNLNDHVPLLVMTIGGRQPPQLTFQENKQLSIIFNKLMNLYDKVNSDGGNKPYYPQFILHAITHMFRNNPDKLRMLDYIHLQSRDTVIKNDKHFKAMCEIADPDDGFIYQPTDPSGRL